MDKADPGASPPKTAGWTVAHAFGELVWLMTQAPGYKHHTLADLEWLVMPALLLEQFRIFHEGPRPVGAVIWAKLDPEIGARMSDARFRLRPDQWRSGAEVWIVDVVTAPAAIPAVQNSMVGDFVRNVFPDVSVKLRRWNPETHEVEIVELRKIEAPPNEAAEPAPKNN